MANRNLNHLKLRKQLQNCSGLLIQSAFLAEHLLSLSTIAALTLPPILFQRPKNVLTILGALTVPPKPTKLEENSTSVFTSRRSQRWSQYIIEKQIGTNPYKSYVRWLHFYIFYLFSITFTCHRASLWPTSLSLLLPDKTSWNLEPSPASDLVEIRSNQHRTNTGLCNMLPWWRCWKDLWDDLGCVTHPEKVGPEPIVILDLVVTPINGRK